jgi:hypothetical protein
MPYDMTYDTYLRVALGGGVRVVVEGQLEVVEIKREYDR